MRRAVLRAVVHLLTRPVAYLSFFTVLAKQPGGGLPAPAGNSDQESGEPLFGYVQQGRSFCKRSDPRANPITNPRDPEIVMPISGPVYRAKREITCSPARTLPGQVRWEALSVGCAPTDPCGL